MVYWFKQMERVYLKKNSSFAFETSLQKLIITINTMTTHTGAHHECYYLNGYPMYNFILVNCILKFKHLIIN